ncbi:MAG: hypothetical protein IMZ65_03785 [Planctomycetes bacterium]|nr:hypothetical protein [Planctomycetota bacterium]
MAFLRWLVLLPAAVASSFVAHMFAAFAQGIAHGSLLGTGDFLVSTDMNGQWITGTIILLIVRGTSGAFSTWVVSRVAPAHKRCAATVWFAFLVVFSVVSVTVFLAVGPKANGFSFWYRSVLELGALVAGSACVLIVNGTDSVDAHKGSA